MRKDVFYVLFFKVFSYLKPFWRKFVFFTILQRTTVNIGQLKIQGVATCQYLCMDSCGLLYGSKEFMEECVFNEMIEKHHYNTYSSARYSNTKRTLYLALNRRGQSRKVQIRANQQLGKLSTYARVLTKPVKPERVEDLLERLVHQHAAATAGAASGKHNRSHDESVHPLRHHGGHLCATLVPSGNKTSVADIPGVDRLRCRKRKKRKKKRRRCLEGEERDGPNGGCVRKPGNGKNVRKHLNNNRKKCKHDNKNKCQRLENGELVNVKKKQKPRKLNPDERLRSRNDGGERRTLKSNKRLLKKVSVPVYVPPMLNDSSIHVGLDDENVTTTTMTTMTTTTLSEYDAVTSTTEVDDDGDGEGYVDDFEQNYDEVVSSTVYYDTSSSASAFTSRLLDKTD